jgi:hypothetical protein
MKQSALRPLKVNVVSRYAVKHPQCDNVTTVIYLRFPQQVCIRSRQPRPKCAVVYIIVRPVSYYTALEEYSKVQVY